MYGSAISAAAGNPSSSCTIIMLIQKWLGSGKYGTRLFFVKFSGSSISRQTYQKHGRIWLVIDFIISSYFYHVILHK